MFTGKLIDSQFRASALLSIAAVLVLTGGVLGQKATPTPTPTPPPEEVLYNGYHMSGSIELGWRWRSLTGNVNKYRSDLNYSQGFRTFDGSVLLESEGVKGKYFDSLLVTNTGWGTDPYGHTRLDIEKTGFYKFDANVRKVNYFNNLSNHALGEHTQNTKNYFSDFDFTLLPQSRKLKLTFGASFNSSVGPGSTTTRAYSDEFAVKTNTDNKANDFRVGGEGNLLGFDWSLLEGFRLFKDSSFYETTGPNPGNNPTNTAALATFYRVFPTQGHAYYTSFNLHRTFAKKFDFTGRAIYSSTNSSNSMSEKITGRDNSNNIVDLDKFTISGDAKRIQKRADIGLTYNVTDNFRISNTFTVDQFAINGGDGFEEELARRNAAGAPLATTFTRQKYYRVNDYSRYVNTLEGDYQINNRVGFHIGYRYTKRNVDVAGYNNTLSSAASATNPLFIDESETNHTNTLIAGMKIKPVDHWVIFWDVEKGSADNVFTRLENYKYTNFRARTRVTIKTVTLNFSAISKDNNNPSKTLDIIPLNFGTVIKNYFYSGTLDWTPTGAVTFSSGYTYHRLTSKTDIIVPIGSTLTRGISEFYMRDHYAYVDVSAKASDRISLYAAYRISRDCGQGDIFSALPQNIITSYPMQYKSPEVRVAFRLTRNVDWNVGYQYYDYKDSQTPTQNYRAHLPYTSLRIYFGNGAVAR